MVGFGNTAANTFEGAYEAIKAIWGLLPAAIGDLAFQAANSLVMSQNLLRKVYFPRLAIPVATVLSAALDFVLAFVVLAAMILFYQIELTARVVWVIPLALLAFATALGAGLWFAALSVRYRDVRFVVPFLVQFWLFATPIAYPSSMLPERWRVFYALNPMTGVVEGFRWALLGANTRPR